MIKINKIININENNYNIIKLITARKKQLFLNVKCYNGILAELFLVCFRIILFSFRNEMLQYNKINNNKKNKATF